MLDGGYLNLRHRRQVIENSDLGLYDYRPAWLTNHDEVAYELTEKGQTFKGTKFRVKVLRFVTKLF